MAFSRQRCGTFLILALAAVAVRTANAQPTSATGSIEGTVVDVHGTSVAGIDVKAATLWSHPTVVKGVSNSDGRFRLENVPAEKVRLWAEKQDSGYYPTRVTIYRDDDRPELIVRVPANDVLRAVRLTLQEPGGLLRGTVRDRVSGKPILARLEFTRADRPRRLERADDDHVEWTNLRGEFTVALPDRPFNLVISDYFHDEWRSETELPAGFVQVRPGETMRIDVELAPQSGSDRP